MNEVFYAGFFARRNPPESIKHSVPRNSSHSYDVVIIGGGVIGSAIAYFLMARADFDGSVAVVEQDHTYAKATSARSVGEIRQQF